MKRPRVPTLMFLLLASAVWAQHPPNPSFSGAQIYVQVRSAAGGAAPVGILVTLEADGAAIISQQQTDATGKVTFHPPGAGYYAVTMSQPGYETLTERVDLHTNPTAYVVFNLKPVPGSEPPVPPEGPNSELSAIPPPAMKEFQKGEKLLKTKNDTSGSIRHLRKAIELYKPFSQAYMLLGLIYLGQQDWKNAEATFQQAAQVDANASGSHLGLGAAFNGEKNYPAAEKELKRGLEINPQAVEGEYELTKTYLAMQQWDDAEPHAAKAVTLQPDFAPAHILMGNILLHKHDPAGALREFREYLHIAPNGPMAEQTHTVVAKIEKALAATK